MKTDLTTLTISDIKQCLSNCGHLINDEDFEFAANFDAFRYCYFDSATKSHVYLVGFTDSDDGFLATEIRVTISSGGIVADYAGLPSYTSSNANNVVHWIHTSVVEPTDQIYVHLYGPGGWLSTEVFSAMEGARMYINDDILPTIGIGDRIIVTGSERPE